jgi:hypothetical protein
MRSLLAVIGLLVLVGCSEQNPPKPPAPQPQEAATNALGVLQKLVTEQNFKGLGFDSVDEVKNAQLGQPLQVFTIGLDKLKGTTTAAEAASVLAPSPETIYPVTVQGAVRSSVTIMHKQEGYAPASFGNAEVIKALSRLRRPEAGANEFVLRIPAFNMYFLARRVENQVMAVPIADDPRIKVKAGEAVPLPTLLEALRPIANEYNGLPM